MVIKIKQKNKLLLIMALIFIMLSFSGCNSDVSPKVNINYVGDSCLYGCSTMGSLIDEKTNVKLGFSEFEEIKNSCSTQCFEYVTELHEELSKES